MMLNRRGLLAGALALPAAGWLANYRSLARAEARQVKITAIKIIGLDNVGDGSLIRMETDAGLVGYGECGLPAAAARTRLAMVQQLLIGQDPLAIERHFHALSTIQYSFISSIPMASGVDIALWDLAGKILGLPIYKLLGGPIRKQIPVYQGGDNTVNWLDKGAVNAWAAREKAAPEKFDCFKVTYTGAPITAGRGRGEDDGEGGGGRRIGGFNATLDNATFTRAGKAFALMREAVGDDIDLAMHCTGQYDTRSAIGLCKVIEPINPMWIEDPITVRFSQAWVELKNSTRVPLLQGEKVEMVEGFKPYLDNSVLSMVQPDVAYSGGITGCRRIADYAALTRIPMGMHSGPCSLIRFYASMHLAAATENFFKVENVLRPSRGDKPNMANGPTPKVVNSLFAVPEGNGLGLDLNEDWMKKHLAKGEVWWA